MAKEGFDCMFMLPEELTGKPYDLCGVSRDVCCHRESCVGRREHTEESRRILARAVEIRRARAEREKNPPLTPQSGI